MPLTIVLIAFSVSADAFAVSVCSGVAYPHFGLHHALRMGSFFGFFQFLMPIIGWLLAAGIASYIHCVDYLIAFCLLAFIGIRMICDALKGKIHTADNLSLGRLLSLSIATSIDAMAVGISLSAVESLSIIPACLLIGTVTLITSTAGGLLGKKVGERFGRQASVAGGAILIAIGIKILAEHVWL